MMCLSVWMSISEAHQVPALLELPLFVFDEIGFGNYYSSCFCAQKHHGPSRWYDICEDGRAASSLYIDPAIQVE